MTIANSSTSSFRAGFLRFLACGVVFWLVGETVVRFDRATLFLGTRAELVGNVYKASSERSLLDAGRFPVRPEDFRVMLIGDSVLYGIGVPPEGVVSAVLREKLRATQAGPGTVFVLDVTCPGNNTYQNWIAFDRYYRAFAPQVVILAYHHDDVYGQQGPSSATGASLPAQPAPARQTERTVARFMSFRNALFASKVIKLVFEKINLEAKIAGLTIPGTEFDHLVNHSHDPDFPGWRDSRGYLTAMATECRTNGSTLIAYLSPELEMLRHYQGLGPVDKLLARFFGDAGVTCINGVDPFLAWPKKNFALSRYDGHPNQAAHQIIADQLFRAIEQARGTPAGAKVETRP